MPNNTSIIYLQNTEFLNLYRVILSYYNSIQLSEYHKAYNGLKRVKISMRYAVQRKEQLFISTAYSLDWSVVVRSKSWYKIRL